MYVETAAFPDHLCLLIGLAFALTVALFNLLRLS